MSGLAILFGCVVGFAMGLTGGGGGVFAVPLLVYALGVAPREAVGISLAAVGGTALFGVAPRATVCRVRHDRSADGCIPLDARVRGLVIADVRRIDACGRVADVGKVS